jgi:hypothetical protein
MVKLVNECREVVFGGIVSQKRCPRCGWLWLPVGIHLLHGEIELVYLEVEENDGETMGKRWICSLVRWMVLAWGMNKECEWAQRCFYLKLGRSDVGKWSA